MISSETAAKKYNTAILKLFEIILGLKESQQRELLKIAENLFVKEKRANIRKSCDIPIYYATSDQVYSSNIKNISASGLFIVSEKMLPVGDELLMTFKMEGLNKPIKLKGEIAHTNSMGMGVKFMDIKPEISRKLKILVEQMRK
jgi:Tfp pilus assembly protein PilZ